MHDDAIEIYNDLVIIGYIIHIGRPRFLVSQRGWVRFWMLVCKVLKFFRPVFYRRYRDIWERDWNAGFPTTQDHMVEPRAESEVSAEPFVPAWQRRDRPPSGREELQG